MIRALVACLCACVTAHAARAELLPAAPAPRLVVTLPDGSRHDGLVVSSEGMACGDAGQATAVPPGCRWSLEGDLTPGCRAILWNVDYSIQCLDTPDWLRKGGGETYRVVIPAHRVLDAAGFSATAPGGGAVVVAWLFAGRVDQVVVVPVLGGSAVASDPLPLRITLPLRRGTEDGAPVLMFWRDGEMVDLAAGLSLVVVADAISASVLGTSEAQQVAAAEAPDVLLKYVLEYSARNGAAEGARLMASRQKLHGADVARALVAAADCGRARTVEVLLPCVPERERESAWRAALGSALAGGHRETAELVHRVAQENKVNLRGAEAGDRAADLGMVDLALALGNRRPQGRGAVDWTAEIARQAEAGHEAMVRALIAAGVAKGKDRLAAGLAGAAASGSISLVDALLEAGARPDSEGDRGPVALALAVQSGRVAVTRRLLDAGADPGALVNKRYPLSRLAVQRDDAPMLRLLIERGSRIDADSGDGVPLLHLALRLRTWGCARVLASAGGRLNIGAEDADALLEDALAGDVVELVERALDDGWAVDRAVTSGCTLAEAASWLRASACLKMLATRGVRQPVSGLVDAGRELSPLSLDLPAELAVVEPQQLAVRGVVRADGRFILPVVVGAEDPYVNMILTAAARAWRFAPIQARDPGGVVQCEIPIRGVGRDSIVPAEEVESAAIFTGPYLHIARVPEERPILGSGSAGLRTREMFVMGSIPFRGDARTTDMRTDQEMVYAAIAAAQEVVQFDRAAEYARQRGAVPVLVTVGRDGRVVDATAMIRPSGTVAKVACERASALGFVPATQGGRFVRTRLVKRIVTEP